MKGRRDSWIFWAQLLPALIPIALCLVFGLWEVLKLSLGFAPLLGMKSVTFGYLMGLWLRPDFWRDLIYTASFSAAAAVVIVLTGAFVAWALTGSRRKSLRILISLCLAVTVILPYGVVALATQTLLGQSGFLARLAAQWQWISAPADFPVFLYTPLGLGLWFPYLWKGSAFVALVLKPYYDKIINTSEPEARTLGAGGLILLHSLYIPSSARLLALSGGVMFAFIFGSFEVPVWLGALNPVLLPARYFRLLMHPDLHKMPERMALVLTMAVLCLLLTLAFVAVLEQVFKRGLGYKHWLVPLSRTVGIKPESGERLRRLTAIVYGGMILLPIVWLVLYGLSPSLRFPLLKPELSGSLDGLQTVVKDPMLRRALGESLMISGATGVVTSLVGFCAGRAFSKRSEIHGRRFAMMFIALPLLFPGVVLITGAQMASIRLGYYGSWLSVVLCHVAMTVPYATGLQAQYQSQTGHAQEEAARTLGGSPLDYLLRVLIPSTLPPLMISFSLGFLMSLTETFSTQMTSGGRILTLGSLLIPALEYGDLFRGSLYTLIFIVLNGGLFLTVHAVSQTYVNRSDYRKERQ